jgi:16S rRNA (guanine966-N2)-methyltransferase
VERSKAWDIFPFAVMRIISGTAGSVPLRVPRSLTRPTTDRVREAVFSSLAEIIPGSKVLDLFAGSGSLGLEALSRGAEDATFIDASNDSIAAIEENLKKTRLENGKAIRRDVLAFLSTISPGIYDLIFADPPYARGEKTTEQLEQFLTHEKLSSSLQGNGILILETLARSPLPETPLWKVTKEKTYGSTRVNFLRPA